MFLFHIYFTCHFRFYRTRSRDSDERHFGLKALASAPASLVLAARQPDLNALDLTYKPSQGVVAALALPRNLPLNFVAGDLCYDMLWHAVPSFTLLHFTLLYFFFLIVFTFLAEFTLITSEAST
jgi:hypothetical protein